MAFDDLMNGDRGWPSLTANNHERNDHSTGVLEPTSYGDAEWRIGWSDGRVGPEQETAKSLFDYESQRRSYEVSRRLKEASEKASALLEKLRQKRDRILADLERIDKAFKDLDDERLASPMSFSRPLGLFYVVVAFVLFVADIPLSLLASDGLGIPSDYDALSDLRKAGASWSASWETIAFALGIAALGLFFKFIADFFFKPKYASNKVVKAISIVSLLAVLALVGSNLFFLAKVRTTVKMMQEASRAQQLGLPGTANANALQDAQYWANLSFICLTVTLPLLGGICASAGWSRLQNATRFAKIEKERLAARETFDKVDEEFQDADAKEKIARYESLHAGDLREAAAKAAYAVYQHGVTRGFAVPETLYNKRRLHERVMFSFKRWLAIAGQRDAIGRDEEVTA